MIAALRYNNVSFLFPFPTDEAKETRRTVLNPSPGFTPFSNALPGIYTAASHELETNDEVTSRKSNFVITHCDTYSHTLRLLCT